ncbi:hypothetical protein BC567DRAFT_237103 [Phyllosticta citribraziliensis]
MPKQPAKWSPPLSIILLFQRETTARLVEVFMQVQESLLQDRVRTESTLATNPRPLAASGNQTVVRSYPAAVSAPLRTTERAG